MPGMTIWPPWVWPESISGTLSAAACDEPPRIVRQQNGRRRAAAHQAREIGRLTRPEAQSDQIEHFPANRHRRARVVQHLDAAPLQFARHLHFVVMIAEHAEHAERRA